MVMKKLLLIDDDVFLRDMYATKFSANEYEVVTAENGALALTVIERDPTFDVIILDMIMPGMSGVELVSEIKNRFPKLDATCIILSNQGQTEDIQAAMRAGADGYIIKAESVPTDVLNKVDELLAKKKILKK